MQRAAGKQLFSDVSMWGSLERLQSATPQFFGWTSHATSLHEVLNEEAGPINCFHRLHCYALISRDTNCAGEAKMQSRDAINPARVLVLASD